MNPNFYDEDDELIENDEAVDDDGSGDQQPDPLNELLSRLDKINATLASERSERLQAQQPAEQILPTVDDDPLDTYDPDKIKESAVEQAKFAFVAMDRMKKDLAAEFGDSLPQEDIDSIVQSIAQLPYKQMKDALGNRGHMLMAYAKLGEAVKSGKVPIDRPKPPKPMPASSKTGVEGSNPMIQYFESIFGPIKSKKQLRRLEAEFGGFKQP